MAFKKGFDPRRAKGGPRPNSGRPQEWLKKLCLEIIDKRKLIQKLADIADGKAVQRITLGSGESILMVAAEVKDRIKATEILLDRGFGKSIQPMEVSGKDGQELTFNVINYANNNHP